MDGLVSSATWRWVLRWSHLLVSSANRRLTRFSQELEVGVKRRWKRGWRTSQRRISAVEWVEELSTITCTSNPTGTAWSS
jgi:hypothetical protein